MDSKILIVDDKREYIQTAMQYIIEDAIPYALLCALNGEDGVEIAVKETPDVIVMDWEMPGINGIEAIKQLKQIESTKEIPVIVSTGIRMSAEDLKVAFDAGASDFIRKPLEKTEFISRISSHLKIANQFRTIKAQQNVLVNKHTIQLKEKIDSLEATLDDDNTFILFLNNALQSILYSLESGGNKKPHSKQEITKLATQLKQLIVSLKRNGLDKKRPGSQFAKKLLEKHPNLTPQEIQLCFMLKNKMCTKDIANITFREESSVKVSRSRLRKKLSLKESDNLNAYFQKF